MNLQGRGRMQQGEFTTESDLTQLSHELSQFFDLGEIRMAGRIGGQASWQSLDELRWQVQGNMQAADLMLAGFGANPWLEEHLNLTFHASGRFDQGQLLAMDSGTLQCDAGTDQFWIQLNSPVSAPWATAEFPLDLRIAGDLGRWRSRIAWIRDEVPHLAGQMELQAKLRARRGAVEFAPIQVSLGQVEWMTPDRTIAEPSLELSAQGALDWQSGQLTCDAATLASTTLSLKADAIHWSLATEGQGEGRVQFRGDLEKLWRRLAMQDTVRPLGQWTGTVEFATALEGTNVRGTSQIRDFQWQQLVATKVQRRANSYQTVWQEPEVQLDLEGLWQSQRGQLQIIHSRCQTPAVGLQLSGTVSPQIVPVQCDLQGTSNVNWDVLSQRLRPWIGPDIQLRGACNEPLRLQGPLSSPTPTTTATVQPTHAQHRVTSSERPPALAGQFGLAWQSIQAYGMLAGPGSLEAQLQQGTLQIAPFSLPLSQGQVRIAPAR